MPKSLDGPIWEEFVRKVEQKIDNNPEINITVTFPLLVGLLKMYATPHPQVWGGDKRRGWRVSAWIGGTRYSFRYDHGTHAIQVWVHADRSELLCSLNDDIEPRSIRELIKAFHEDPIVPALAA